MNKADAVELTHLNSSGQAHMVDVLAKEPTRRRALAKCQVEMTAETVSTVATGDAIKGDVLAVARVAGIQAAKRASDLIPLCHPLMIGSVSIDFELKETHIAIAAEVETIERTGVEMEALTACSVAALTIYDMCKSVDKNMTITDIALWEKSGGKSGEYSRSSD
jgi:cyclic pyranopterin phosphate synthase